MRILLDEDTPRGVRRILTGHHVRTVPEMGWNGYSNGQLLDEAEKAAFEAIVTCDQNLVTQQNLTGRNIAVVVCSTNRWAVIRAQPDTVRRAIAAAAPGLFTFASFGPARRSRHPRCPPAPTC
jgi:hypothetical protein